MTKNSTIDVMCWSNSCFICVDTEHTEHKATLLLDIQIMGQPNLTSNVKDLDINSHTFSDEHKHDPE